jgi:hypothetical protein
MVSIEAPANHANERELQNYGRKKAQRTQKKKIGVNHVQIDSLMQPILLHRFFVFVDFVPLCGQNLI